MNIWSKCGKRAILHRQEKSAEKAISKQKQQTQIPCSRLLCKESDHAGSTCTLHVFRPWEFLSHFSVAFRIFYVASRIFLCRISHFSMSHLAFSVASRIFYVASRIFLCRISYFLLHRIFVASHFSMSHLVFSMLHRIFLSHRIFLCRMAFFCHIAFFCRISHFLSHRIFYVASHFSTSHLAFFCRISHFLCRISHFSISYRIFPPQFFFH